MNCGHDFAAALVLAQADEKLRTRYFTRPVSVAINTAECRACTAPGVKGNCASQGRSTSSQDNGVSQSQLKKIKQQAKAEAEREAKRKFSLMSIANSGGPPAGQISARAKKKARQLANRNLALQNGGDRDGSDGGFPRLMNVPANVPPPPNGGKATGKGGRDSHNGKPICYNWNRGAPCKQQNCPMAHVCLICKGDHKKKDHPGSGM